MSKATDVNVVSKIVATIIVLLARMGPREVAKIAARDRMKVMRSRRHSGQFRGSFGSSEG